MYSAGVGRNYAHRGSCRLIVARIMGMLMICTHVEITSAGSALYGRDRGKEEA